MLRREHCLGSMVMAALAASLLVAPQAMANRAPPEPPQEPPRFPARVPFEVQYDVTKGHSRLIVPRSMKGQFAGLEDVQETSHLAASNRSWIAGLALAIGIVTGGLILVKTKKTRHAVIAALFLALTIGVCGPTIADLAPPPPEFRPKENRGSGELEIVIAPRGDKVILIMGRKAMKDTRR